MHRAAQDKNTLVIGWGNELRGDDAAGLHFVRRLESVDPPGVDTLEVPQLTPELALDVAGAGKVIFVDASLSGETKACREPRLQKVGPASSPPTASRRIPTCIHSLGPEGVLDLAESLYGHRPEAWILSLPVESLEIGFGLSDFAEDAISKAFSSLVPDHSSFNPVPS